MEPSIQTAPLGFKPNVTGPDVVASYAEHVLRVAAHLVDLERRTGTTVTLAIEPEPYCFLETTDETVAFFDEHLYSGPAATRLAELADLPVSHAHMALRRHLGIVFDICHQAVEYEDMSSVARPARRCGDSDPEAAGSRRPADPPRHRRDRRGPAPLRRDGVPDADARDAGRKDDPLSQPRGCHRGLGGGRP